MFVFLLFLLLVILITLRVIIRDSMSRLFGLVIFSYWFIVLLISQFNPFELYDVSLSSNLMVLLGVISFIIGYSSIPWNKFSNYSSYKIDYKYGIIDLDYVLKNKYIRLIFLACFLIILNVARKQWVVILLQGGLGNLKLDLFELVFEGNHLLYFIYNVVIFPMFHLCIAIESFMIINFERKRLKYLLIIALYILVFCFVGGKRAYFLTFFFSFFYVLLLSSTCIIRYKRQSHFIRKSILPIAVFFSFAFVGMIYMTSLSGGTDSDSDRMKEVGTDLAKQFVVYSVGPLRALDISMKKDYVGTTGGHTWGVASFGGALEYYMCALNNRLGGDAKTVNYRTMVVMQDNEVAIGKDTTFNYAYTAFLYFYYDFNIIGIIIISFLYGFFVRFLILQLTRYRTVGAMAVVGFQFFICMQYLQFWAYTVLYAQPVLVYFYYLHKKEINNKKTAYKLLLSNKNK